MSVKGYKKGYLIWSNLPITINGFYSLNGQTITDSTFLQYVNSIEHNELHFCSQSDYDASINKYGTCGKFVLTNKLKLPTTRDIVDKDITTYSPDILQERLKHYSVNIAYPGFTGITDKIYTEESCYYKYRKVREVDLYTQNLKGFMYLLIKDLDLEYYLDDDIPDVMLRKL